MSEHHHEDTTFNIHSVSQSKRRKHGPCSLLTAAKHNKRELAAELNGKGRSDIDRVPLNYSLMGGGNAVTVDSMAMERMKEVGVRREDMRHDHTQALEALAAAPQGVVEDLEAYFRDFVAWCVKRYGAENILSADVHMDESRPHCHVLIAPIEDGLWSGGKKMIGSARFGEIVDSFWQEVGSKHGIKRPDKLTGQRKAAAAALVLEHIENHDKELFKSPAWEAIRKSFERDPTGYITAYGLVLPDKPEQKQRTSTQILTSKGKGPKQEPVYPKKRKSYDFQNQDGHAPVAVKSKDFGADNRGIDATASKSYDFQNQVENQQSHICMTSNLITNSIASVGRVFVAGTGDGGLGAKAREIPAIPGVWFADGGQLKQRDLTKGGDLNATPSRIDQDDDGRTVERDCDVPDWDRPRRTKPDRAMVVIDDDGAIRERDTPANWEDTEPLDLAGW